MLFLLVAFLGGIFILFFFYTKNKNATTSSFPSLVLKASPTPELPLVSPTPIDPLTQKGRQLFDDLNKIKQDVLTNQQVDSRLDSPVFYIEKEILE